MKTRKIGNGLALAGFAVFALLAYPARAADLEVTVNPSEVSEGEAVQLRIQTQVPLNTVVFDPEFEASDFTKLGSSSQGMSVSYTSDSSQAVKTIYYTFVLSPNKAGNLGIRNIRLRTNQGVLSAADQVVHVAADSGGQKKKAKPQAQHRRGGNPLIDPNDPFAAMLKNFPGLPPGFLTGDEDDADLLPPDQDDEQNPAAPQGFGQAPPGLSNPAPPGAGRLGALNTRDRPAELNSDFTVYAQVSKKKAYVGEPIVVEYWLYDWGGLMQVEVQKWPVFTGFWKDDLEIATRFEFEQTFVNNRLARRAFLGRYAIYALKPGKQELDRLTIRGTYAERQGFFRGPTRTGTHASQEEMLEILPLPTEGRPADFSGAVGKFALKLNSDKTAVAQNTPVTFSLVLNGAGNFQSIESIPLKLPPDFELYDSNTGSRGVVALGARRDLENSKTFTYTAIPRKAGKFTVGPIAWTYFDPESSKYVTINTQSIELNVTESAAGASQGNNSYLSPSTGGSGSGPASGEIRGLHPIPDHGPMNTSLWWKIGLAALALVNITLLYRFLETRFAGWFGRYLDDPFEEAKQEWGKAKVAQDGSWVSHLENALLTAMEVRLGTNPRGMPKAERQAAWEEKGLSAPLYHRIEGLLDRMDQHRFSAGKGTANARTQLQNEVGQILQELARKKA